MEGNNMTGQLHYKKLLLHLFIIAFGIVMLYPILWLISSSFKPQSLIFSDVSLWPAKVTLENYINGWAGFGGTTFGRFFLNSFTISIICVIGNVITCSMAAYAFARLNFRLKKMWFAIMLITIMLPYHVTVVPQYILFRNLDWVNTILP